MISVPQETPIIPQNANVQPFPQQTASYPGDEAVQQGAQGGGGMLQRAAMQSPMGWGQQRQALPQAQAPMYRPQPQFQGGGPYGPGGGGYGGPPPWQQQQQMPQWAPPWMQGGGGGWGGPPPWMQQRQQFQPQQQYAPQQAYQPQQNPYQPQQQPSAPYMPQQQQYRAPNGNTGFAGPQYNSQAIRPQPAGTVNAPAPQAAPPALPNRQAAITPTPIYNRGNELA